MTEELKWPTRITKQEEKLRRKHDIILDIAPENMKRACLLANDCIEKKRKQFEKTKCDQNADIKKMWNHAYQGFLAEDVFNKFIGCPPIKYLETYDDGSDCTHRKYGRMQTKYRDKYGNAWLCKNLEKNPPWNYGVLIYPDNNAFKLRISGVFTAGEYEEHSYLGTIGQGPRLCMDLILMGFPDIFFADYLR